MKNMFHMTLYSFLDIINKKKEPSKVDKVTSMVLDLVDIVFKAASSKQVVKIFYSIIDIHLKLEYFFMMV